MGLIVLLSISIHNCYIGPMIAGFSIDYAGRPHRRSDGTAAHREQRCAHRNSPDRRGTRHGERFTMSRFIMSRLFMSRFTTSRLI
jgi:hypothetical protein